MRDAFLGQVEELKSKIKEEKLSVPRVGLEIEYFVMKGLEPGNVKKVVDDEHINTELGSFQVEVNTSPIDLVRGSQLEEEILRHEKTMMSKVGKQSIVRLGAFPTVAPKDAVLTDKEKYRIVPKYHDDNRRYHVDTMIGGVDFGTAKSAALFSSLQVNKQASTLEEAVDLMNRSFMISPYLVACSGNARIVDRTDTGIDDVRMIAWLASHDVRRKGDTSETRIGTPLEYFRSIDDYFNRIAAHPFILEDKEHALGIGIGLCWLDCRIKFIDDVPIVEYRAMSTQPNAKDDVAMSLFYLGRLEWSAASDEPLQDMEQVHTNRSSALLHGLRGQLDGRSAVEVIHEELLKAEEGLCMLGVTHKKYTNIIRRRLKRGKTPAQEFAERLQKMTIQEALIGYKL